MKLHNPVVAVAAIVVIGVIEVFALRSGVDGGLMAVTVGAIAGIAGYAVQPKGGKAS